MNEDRTQLWGVDIAEGRADGSADVAPFVDRGQTFLGIAVEVHDDIEEGQHRLMLTAHEARMLHAALGTALAEEGVAK